MIIMIIIMIIMIINDNADAYNCTMTGGWRGARVEGGD